MIIALLGAISSDAQSFVYDCMFIICKFSKILFNIKGYSIKKTEVTYFYNANIVQMVKTCYKIKIDFRDSLCCFYWFLQRCRHSE